MLLRPAQHLLVRVAIDLTPCWVRTLLGLNGHGLHAWEAEAIRQAGGFADHLVLESNPAVQACRHQMPRVTFVSLPGLTHAVAFIRNPENKSDVVKILAKGMRLPRVEDAEEGYQSMVGLYEKKLYPSVEGIRNVIRLLGMTNEKIRRLKAEDLVDDSVVKKLEKDGRF